MPEAVEDCVKSILEDNPDMDKDRAYAICNSMQNKGKLQEFQELLDAEPEGERQALAALAEFRNPGDITRIEQGGDVIYRRVMLLAPGTWTDAGSRETVLYDGDAIRQSADQWTDHEINLLHGPALHAADALGEVGEVIPDSLIVDDQDRLFADLRLHGETPASELAVELMDEALETNGQQGIDGPSVEIVDDETRWDDERGLSVMEDMTFGGIGLVFNPASEPVDLQNQIRERAVAMADGESDPATGVLVRDEDSDTIGGTFKPEIRPGRLMGSEREEFERLLEEMDERYRQMARLLQDDEELQMVQELIGAFLDGEGEPDAPVADLMEYAQGEVGDEDLSAVEDVVQAYLDAADADGPDETPVSGLQSWIDEAFGDEEGQGDDEDTDDDEDGQLSEDELQDAKQTIAQFNDHMEDISEMLSGLDDRLDAVEATADEVEEIDRRLAALEDEPQQRSLAEPRETEFIDTDSDGETDHEEIHL